MSERTYASTHSHPMHIDIPTAAEPSRAPIDEANTLEGSVLGEEGNEDMEPATPSAARPPPAKGILKNPLRRPSQIGPNDQPAIDAERVQWDEKNLAETEIGKDSLMKISEPKTPYVWGDPEKDMMLTDVPDFDLQSSNPQSPSRSTSDRRPSMTSSSRSGSSSRSASFSLPTKDHPVRPGGSGQPRSRTPSDAASAHLITPNPASDSGGQVSAIPSGSGMEITGMALGATSANTAANAQRPKLGVDGEQEGGEVFSDSDEEMDEEAKQKHKEFQGKRKEHYAKEAKLAMEKARRLMAEDAAGNGDGDGEEEGEGDGEEEGEGDGGMEIDEEVNGGSGQI